VVVPPLESAGLAPTEGPDPPSRRSKSSHPLPFSLSTRPDMSGAATLRSRAAVAAAVCLAVVAAAALLHRRRRRNRAPASPRRLGVGVRRGRPRRACEEEEKPQARFKRVLADNSYSPFKHLRRQSAQPGGAEGEAPPFPSEGTRSWCPCPARGDLCVAGVIVWLF